LAVVMLLPPTLRLRSDFPDRKGLAKGPATKDHRGTLVRQSTRVVPKMRLEEAGLTTDPGLAGPPAPAPIPRRRGQGGNHFTPSVLSTPDRTQELDFSPRLRRSISPRAFGRGRDRQLARRRRRERIPRDDKATVKRIGGRRFSRWSVL
jgi:hypothetical protein